MLILAISTGIIMTAPGADLVGPWMVNIQAKKTFASEKGKRTFGAYKYEHEQKGAEDQND
jgi:hypothetical protein